MGRKSQNTSWMSDRDLMESIAHGLEELSQRLERVEMLVECANRDSEEEDTFAEEYGHSDLQSLEDHLERIEDHLERIEDKQDSLEDDISDLSRAVGNLDSYMKYRV